MTGAAPFDPPFDLTDKRIWVAGHRGMVGAAVVRRLQAEPCRVVTAGRETVDLRRQSEVEAWMAEARPHVVVLAAATVGGILANSTRPADFIHDNLAIEVNVVQAAARLGVEKLLLLGSSCIYPREAAQPMREEALLTGPLEATNEWYAVAKIAGIKLCQAYRRQYGCDFNAAMPTNLYGPGDNFDLRESHVVPGLLRRMQEAKESGAAQVAVWGTGRPRRELLYVDDCADALVHMLKAYSGEMHLNIGTGRDVTIAGLAHAIAEVVGYGGEIVFDTSMPDGAPRKLLDVSRLRALGWRPRTTLKAGLRATHAWFLDHRDEARTGT